MTKEKARYLENKARVAEIQGIKLPNKNHNCHHEIQRIDVGKLVGEDFDIDGKGNLFFVTLEEHDWINHMINEDEHFSRKKPKDKRKKYY